MTVLSLALKRPLLRGHGGDRSRPATVLRARNALAVRAWVDRARRERRRVRVFGTRSSPNDAWSTDDVALDGCALDGELVWLGSVERPLVRVPAGWKLARLLEELARFGHTLPSIPNYTGVTLAGGIATGSHGATLHHPPLGACARAFEIVDGRSRHLWIESARDPVLDEVDSGTIVRDDGLFDALGVSLGALGVVISVVIEPVPCFWLSDERAHVPYDDVRDAITSGRFASRHGYSALVHPYTRRCSVGQGDRFACAPDRESDPAGALDPLRALVTHVGLIPRFWQDPHAIPGHLSRGLEVFAPARRTYAPGHRIMGTDFAGLPPRGVATEIAIPLDVASEPSRRAAVAALDGIFDSCDRLARRGRFVGGYVSVRFARRWDAVLSPTEGSDALFAEILMLDGTPFLRDTLRDLEEAHGRGRRRRHFGLIHHVDAAEMDALYPRIGTFRRALVELDPEGVLSNAFTEQLGLVAERAPSAGRARAGGGR